MKKAIKYCLLVTLGLAVAGCSKDGGHTKVQLWKDGPYWAETNIGAEDPWEYGYYFWWGDTIGYKRENNAWVASDGSSSSFSFKEKNTTTLDKSKPALRREEWITADGVLAPKHDAAHVHWGGEWRMPTDEELEALYRRCKWEWKVLNGVKGYVVRGTGDYASASIFLPCAGRGDGTSLDDAGSEGYYWSSVPHSDVTDACGLDFDSSDYITINDYRYYGQSVRPVQGFTK